MNFLDGLAATVNRGFCVALGSVANAAEVFRYIATPAGLDAPNPFAALYAQNCPTDPVPSPAPQFSGGQCPGVIYRVNVSARTRYLGGASGAPIDFGVATQEALVTAPIQSILGQSNGGSARVDVVGTTTVSILVTAGITAAEQDKWVIEGVTVNSIVREDGLPDTCGDPAPVIPPYIPGGNTYNDNTTVTVNDVDITIPVALVFGYATLNVDGTVNIPINASFSANPEFNGNFNFNLNTGDLVPDFSNPSAPLPSPCSDPGGYIPDPSIPAPPDSIPNAPDLPPPVDAPTERQRLLKGCIVTTTSLDGNETTILQQENPDIYVPAVGYVQFQIQIGNVSAWTNDIPVKSLRAFIPCPWDAGAIDVKGTPRYGNLFQVTPVYVTRTFNPTYPPDSP